MKTKSPPPFRERIEKFTARQIADAVGCPLPTAYDWRSGRRAPPVWLRDKFVSDIAAASKERE